jgi:CubicO group peptidase (beta-lactamase class C family)
LNGKVADYLNVPSNSAVGYIKIKELLLHQSGLQAQMPLSKFFSAKNVPAKGCNDYFCRKRKGSYSVKVADGLYFKSSFRDTVSKRVFNLAVNPKPRFRYSDVNFYLLKRIVEAVSNTPFDQYAFEQVYRPLGLRNMTFNPLYSFPKSQIVPTEQDNYWRKTLVQGYVHDPSVALMGGVGGSAGLFSNAEDLAVIFHMLLEGGIYGGLQFFEQKTVDDFVDNKYANHRGLGFDKPTKRRYPTYSPHASPKSFGHTGFTGTCVWVDPDQRLVYVFLSNRVNPSSRNGKIFTEGIRSRIHEVVYSAFGSFQNSLPELEVEEETIEVEEGAGG